MFVRMFERLTPAGVKPPKVTVRALIRDAVGVTRGPYEITLPYEAWSHLVVNNGAVTIGDLAGAKYQALHPDRPLRSQP